jgi:integrase
MTDIHNLAQRVRRLRTNIQESDDISDVNTEVLVEFLRWLEDQNLSKGRIDRYLQTGKRIAEYNDFDLRPMTKEKLRAIKTQVEDSAYYHKEYAPSTKEEYWKFPRTFCKFEDGLSIENDVPDRADFIPTTADKTFTKPSELLTPEHIRAACRNLSNLRDQAFLLTQWDAGSRVGETTACRVGDVFRENGRWMLHIHGNKNSPDRDAWVHIAGPAITRWLDEAHPASEDDEAYLFCKLATEDPYSIPHYRRFRAIAAKAKQAAGIEQDLQRTHLFRKSRVSYLKSAMNMAESAIDRRIGHVMNSDTTRRYTRIGDAESNSNYGGTYGLDVEDDQEEDLLPQECGDCGDVNAGFRDRCYTCDGPLTALKEESLEIQSERAKSLIIDAMQEQGMLDELQKVLGES